MDEIEKINPVYFHQVKNKMGDEARIRTLKHAFRVNGVIDVWKNGKTLFDNEMKVYLEFNETSKMLAKAKELVSVYAPKNDFKTGKYGISMQEFRSNKFNPHLEVKKRDKLHGYKYQWEHVEKEYSDQHLYFISNEIGHVKIGKAKDVEKRLKSGQTFCSTKLTIELIISNGGKLEGFIHKLFHKQRHSGEWFLLDSNLSGFIKWLKDQKNEFTFK